MTKSQFLLARATNARRCSERRARRRLLPFRPILLTGLIWLIWLIWFIVLTVLGCERKLDSLIKKLHSKDAGIPALWYTLSGFVIWQFRASLQLSGTVWSFCLEILGVEGHWGSSCRVLCGLVVWQLRAPRKTGAPAVGYVLSCLLYVCVYVCREAQRGPERPRESQRGLETPREAQRGPERPGEAQRCM